MVKTLQGAQVRSRVGELRSYMWCGKAKKKNTKIYLEKEMATHSSILAWRVPWTEVSGRL